MEAQEAAALAAAEAAFAPREEFAGGEGESAEDASMAMEDGTPEESPQSGDGGNPSPTE